jgi:hypothetical protein
VLLFALAVAIAFLLAEAQVRSHGLPPPVSLLARLACEILAIVSILRWSRMRGWHAPHHLALAAGAALTYASFGLSAFLQVPLARESVIHKRSCDAFHDTALQATLAERGITRLIVVGCMTQFCIDTSCRRAVSLGYDVILASDGHMNAGSGRLSFADVIEHHNHVLDGFDAGPHEVRIASIQAIASGDVPP